ncbi:alpha/beta fold hydrolase [Nocardia uniformis]|uniref:Alpha/beta fold hydrolase n=1 Tax=Nocardia uniformis TaxID=53432 RepID=A0A849C9C9_9NOCA|nr:alpha/beta fold hydrolase [Nocardia uniformis]NNH74328.1 alpha/beta fold hydrolase [Nocardia uniformis]
MATSIGELLREHEAAGRYLDVGGVRTFVRDEGTGRPVVLVHGVPVSSYLWRRVLNELAAQGLRGIAPDLPGLGLSARPTDFDYTWTGLGRHLAATVDALGLERFHLVVHDIGGPIGFEVAARMPERIASLTVLDTIVDAHTFHKPWSMAPFAIPGLDRLWLAGGRGPIFRILMRWIGLAPGTATTAAEIDLHRMLLTRVDGGRAFLQIMHSFETTPEKTARYRQVLAAKEYPVQVVWARDDPVLTLERHGRIAADAAGLPGPDVVPGKHFFPEDSAQQTVERIAEIVTRTGGSGA